MKKYFRRPGLCLPLCAALLLSGCDTQASTTEQSTSSPSTESASSASSIVQTQSTNEWFSDRDLDGSYEESQAISIVFQGDTASCSSDAVAVEDGRVTISDEGVYLLSGSWEDGQIVIYADDSDKVQLVLNGVDLTSSTSAAIYALQADKVFLTLAEGTENTLSNGGEYVAIDDNNIDAVIFSKTDLTLNGSGSLTIQAPIGHGVVSKDDLVVTGGSYTITAASTGMTGKDSLAIAGGTFHITSGKDALHAENEDDTTLGCLYIADGTFTVDAQGDAISASGTLQIDGGSFDLTTAGGSASVSMTTSDTFSSNQRGGARAASGMEAPSATPTSTAATEETDSSTSEKGIKAEGALTINGGLFSLDTADDAIHTGGPLLITAGEFTLSSGDDAIHSDDALTIQGGTFTIPYCYEGIEGLSITVDDGIFDIVSYDDGINAAGGVDNSGFGGGRYDSFSTTSDSFITINGGTFTIVSQGDCIDSNGALTINGGTLDLTCNGAGNTALDTDGTYSNNGGSITTNDGSESNPGSMGSGGRAGGQMKNMQRDTAPQASTTDSSA